jgi:hypothetical protein
MLAWFGGISLDLRDAELASNARLSVATEARVLAVAGLALLGGISAGASAEP